MTVADSLLNQAWLRGLREQLDRAPARPRVPLLLAHGDGSEPVAIGSIESASALQLAGAGLALRDDGGAWRIEVPAGATPKAALAAIAHWLHANGLGSAWRGELLSVTDAAGTSVASIERAAVRPLGIATFAVHLVACDADGCIWVQQRAFDKATDPGRWDTTMGGLVSAGETIAQTLERETWEEAGLHIGALRGVAPFGRCTVRRPLPRGYMVENIEMFEAVVPQGQTPINQDGEVERFECLDRAALVARLHADAFTFEAANILATWLEQH